MKEKSAHNRRIIAYGVFMLFIWGLVIYRLYALQIKDNSNFVVLANSQQGYQSSVQASRGIIQSADGIDLAINIPSYDVYVYTPNITDEQNFENSILSTLHFDISKFHTIEGQGSRYFQIGKGISANQKDQLTNALSEKNTGSIDFALVEKRNYPNDTLLSHVLGYMDVGNGKGVYGIEGYFDQDLRGINGQITGNKDQKGNPIVNGNFSFTPPTPGENITLTINAFIQKAVEEKLQYWTDQEQADAGTVIVMDPKTGNIVAMANYPTYNPNAYFNGYTIDCNNKTFSDLDICKNPDAAKGQPVDPSLINPAFNNSAISFSYEPGSVMKAVTVAAALQEKKADEKTIFDDTTGYYEASTKRIYNFNKKANGNMTMGDILKLSSNVGASMVAEKLGNNLLYKYYKAFGLGQSTGIQLDGESYASIPDESTWLPIDLATASFGQFAGATPLQVADIYQALANGGVRMQPNIVQSVVKDGITVATKPRSLGRVISAQNDAKLTDMLIYTTTGEPAYGLRNLKQYMPIIASKTGTAQVPTPDKAGYLDGVINATYVGYAPAHNPKFVLYVMLQNPRAGIYAATTAVPLWADIVKDLFIYYKIPPQ